MSDAVRPAPVSVQTRLPLSVPGCASAADESTLRLMQHAHDTSDQPARRARAVAVPAATSMEVASSIAAFLLLALLVLLL